MNDTTKVGIICFVAGAGFGLGTYSMFNPSMAMSVCAIGACTVSWILNFTLFRKKG